MMKFKIGDQVDVISLGDGDGWVSSMDRYLHKTGTIIADYRTDPANLGFLDNAWDEKAIRYMVEFKRDGWSTIEYGYFQEDSLQLINQKRHKQADLIHAWIEGAEIEYKDPETGLWFDWDSDAWNDELECRIKPNWWENIPDQGVLVKEINNHKNIMLWLQSYRYHEYWTPLTNEEIERFKR